MKSSFENLKLKDISKIYSGNSINEKIKEQKYTGLENGVEYISTKDISFNSEISYDNGVRIPFNELDNFKTAPTNTVFICAEGGSAGRKLAISDRELCFVNKLFAVVASKLVLPKYLFYSLKTEDFIEQFNGSMTGIIGGVSLNKFRELEIKVPSISIQQKIVAKLDTIFVEIDIAIAAAEANSKNAEALFQSYLTEVFDRGGDGWVLKKISDVADLIDSLHKTPKYADDGFPMVRVTDIKVGELNLTKTKKVDEVTFNEFSKRHTPKIGDIVFSRVGSYGVSAIVSTNEKFCLGQNTVFIIPKINSVFLYYFLNSGFAKKQYDDLKDGVTQPTISLKSIKSVAIPIPPEREMEKLNIKFKELYIQSTISKQRYVEKIQQLKSLKQSILKQTFNGELVKD